MVSVNPGVCFPTSVVDTRKHTSSQAVQRLEETDSQKYSFGLHLARFETQRPSAIFRSHQV